MKNIVILLLVLFQINSNLKAQQIMLELGPNTVAETSFLSSSNLRMDFKGYNFNIIYHKTFQKNAIEYNLGYNQFTQLPLNQDLYDGAGSLDVEKEVTYNLSKINTLSIGIMGLISVYKKYMYLTFDFSLINTFSHEGNLKSAVFSGNGAIINNYEYAYHATNNINPAIGFGTLLFIPITKKVCFTIRFNLTSIFGENNFSVIKNPSTSIFQTEENRLYISDYISSTFGLGYSLH